MEKPRSTEELGEMEMDDFFLFHSPVASSTLRKFLSNDDGGGGKNMSDSEYSTACLLKKASIVRSIQEGMADGSVSEEMLDSLLLIEQVDRKQGLPVSDSMKAAFCAVALHCTLGSLVRSWACYYGAVQRIWGLRIRNLEDSRGSQLVGPDLVKWREDVEAALWDSEVSQRLLRINSRGDALHCLRVYVEEAQSLMKPAFLKLTSVAAQASGRPRSRADKGKRPMMANQQKRNNLCFSHRHSRGGVRIADAEEELPSSSKFASSTAEAKQVQEKLKSCAKDLLAAVTDPLPEVIEVAEKVASEIRGIKHSRTILEDCDKDKDVPPSSGNPTKESAQATRLASDIERENLQAKVTVEEHSKDKSDPHVKDSNPQTGAPKPSLMERNGTAKTFEWEDSIDGSSQGTSGDSSRCCLPSPKLRPVSPLKVHETKKWVRRRKVNRWSIHEEHVLREATEKYGSHWKQILNAYPGVFINRTPVDLKDKWRNMTGG